MRKTVYIESSVVSYCANEISSDLKVAAEQRITHEWWKLVLPKVNAYVSDYVLEEIKKGDPGSAAARIKIAQLLPLLPEKNETFALATEYIKHLALPKDGEIDAFHLAVAAVYEIDFILTWNCKHIANAFKFPQIRKINHKMGYRSPTICTPRELMEVPHG
ncbi:type II toxin-antitoxin system VapC family toxin [Bdellovibrionota bacterium FG-2]